MSFTNDISFYPTKPIKNSHIIINYSGKLKNSQKLFIEYDFKDFKGLDNKDTKVSEMLTINDYFYSLINLEDVDHIYFRFVNNDGTIDDLNGVTYCEKVYENSDVPLNNQETNETVYNLVGNNLLNNQGADTESNTSSSVIMQDTSTDSTPTSLAMVPMKEKDLIHARKGLRFSYRINKRIKLILIKIFRSLPSFITGNYRRRINL